MIGQIGFAVALHWTAGYRQHLLYVAARYGYVIAWNSNKDRVLAPQTRQQNPKRFWTNVIVAVVVAAAIVAELCGR